MTKKKATTRTKRQPRSGKTAAPKTRGGQVVEVKPAPVPATGQALVLRTCAADMTARNGFRWPEAGPVAAPDWAPTEVCGSGLHGLLWGEGIGSLLSWAPDARWLVVAVDLADVIELDGKVKFPRGTVVHCGDRVSATRYLAENGGAGRRITGGTATAGYGGTATAGDRGTATAGYGGTATAGDRGTATAGDRGTATAGESGTATAGESGTATAGESGVIAIRWWDGAKNRYRFVLGYIGEDGLEANAKYRLDEAAKFVKVATEPVQS